MRDIQSIQSGAATGLREHRTECADAKHTEIAIRGAYRQSPNMANSRSRPIGSLYRFHQAGLFILFFICRARS
jgi:hypothetical protein